MARDERGRFRTKKVPEEVVQAKVVEFSEDVPPFPATVVEDQTDKLGKRLFFLAFALMVLFFVISSYIQAAKNANLLEDEVNTNNRLAASVEKLAVTLEEQTLLIAQLQEAIRQQNLALQEAGVDPISIPGNPGGASPSTPSEPSASTPTPRPRPAPAPRNNPEPNDPEPNDPEPNDPEPNDPEPEPEPDPPGPLDPVTNPICQLTGICT